MTIYVNDFYKRLITQPVPSEAVKRYVSILAVNSEKAKKGVKFMLPDGGELIKDRDFKAFPFGNVRLPFPLVVLEYFEPDQDLQNGGLWASNKRIVVLEEVEEDGVMSIAIHPICHDKINGTWVFQDTLKFPCDIKPDELRWDNDFLYVARTYMLNHTGIKYSSGDYIGELATLLSFLSALSCNNVVIEKIVNSRRTKNKLPISFDDYHILTLTNKSSSELKNLGGTHRSPREHLRRGHIRCLANGEKTWVNACVVNAGTAGKVRKSYAFHN